MTKRERKKLKDAIAAWPKWRFVPRMDEGKTKRLEYLPFVGMGAPSNYPEDEYESQASGVQA